MVCDYNYNVSIPLSVSFSCSVIPAKRTQIPCPEMVTQWPHLAPIATSLPPYYHNIEVGLLIGSNCSRAIMPREIVAGPDNKPYERKSAEQSMSLDDKKFMQKMKQGIRQGKDGHYEMPLPFRGEEPRMSNNRSLATHRLAKLKTRLENDDQAKPRCLHVRCEINVLPV